MTLSHLATLLLAAAGAGAVDAVVGGGGLILLPALLVAFPTTATATLLGTNKLTAIAGTTTAAATYLRRTKVDWRLLGPTAGLALVCSAVGGLLAGAVPADVYRPVVIGVLAGRGGGGDRPAGLRHDHPRAPAHPGPGRGHRAARRGGDSALRRRDRSGYRLVPVAGLHRAAGYRLPARLGDGQDRQRRHQPRCAAHLRCLRTRDVAARRGDGGRQHRRRPDSAPDWRSTGAPSSSARCCWWSCSRCSPSCPTTST